jgi:hypothetical protein
MCLSAFAVMNGSRTAARLRCASDSGFRLGLHDHQDRERETRRDLAQKTRKGNGQGCSLTNAGVRHFGSWPEAHKAAGFDARALLFDMKRKVRTYLDGDSVVLPIRARHQGRLPMTAAQLTRGPDQDQKLLHSGTEYFGKWDLALEAAGLDPSKIRQQMCFARRHYPDPDPVLSGIRRRIIRGLPMNRT